MDKKMTLNEMVRTARKEQAQCFQTKQHHWSLADHADSKTLKQWHKYNLLQPEQIFIRSNALCILDCPDHGEYLTAANKIAEGTQSCPTCWKIKHDRAVAKENAERKKRGRGRPTKDQKVLEYHPVACYWCGHEEYWRQVDLDSQVFCPNCDGMVQPRGRDFMSEQEFVPGIHFAPYHNADFVVNMVHRKSERFITWQCDYGHRFRCQMRELMAKNGCPICQSQRAKADAEAEAEAAPMSPAESQPAGKAWAKAS